MSRDAARPLLEHLARKMACLLHGAVESPDYTKEELGKLPRWVSDVQEMLIEILSATMIPPCPFCGQLPVVVNEPPFVRIFCPGPGNQCVCPKAEAETLEGALKLWCRRPPERTDSC